MLWIESQPKVFVVGLDLNPLPTTWVQRSQVLGFWDARWGSLQNNFHSKLKIYVLGSEFYSLWGCSKSIKVAHGGKRLTCEN
jgi:hypothetical protein